MRRASSRLALLLSLGAAACDPSSEQVADVKWVLLDSDPVQQGCPSDRTFRTEDSEIVDADASADCRTDVAVFADRRAPSLSLDQAWADGRLAVEAGSEPLKVRLNVVVVLGPDDARDVVEQEVKAELLWAYELFDRHRLGVEFVADDITFVPLDDEPRASRLAQGCLAVAGTELHPEGEITVIYVTPAEAGFDGDYLTYYGYNCRGRGHQNLIFIDPDHADATLAHELGHALSLNHVRAEEAHNLMRCCVFAPDGEPVDRLTMGQAYRAAFGAGSWLMVMRSHDGGKYCQGTAYGEDYDGDWPCPRLLLEWP